VTEDWYFISHRLPMARAARNAGFEGHVATRVDRYRGAIEAEGFHLHPISWRRGSLDPRDLVRVVREVRRLYRRIKPELAHHVALPATVVGSLAAVGLPIVCLNAMTGLGTMFTSDKAKVRLARVLLTLSLRRLLNRPRSAVLVQNLDDQAVIERLGVDGERIALIPGSGVDIDTLTPKPEPAGPVTIAFVSRWWSQGAAHADGGARAPRPARPRYPAAHRRAAGCGKPDLGPQQEIEAWSRRPMSRISVSWKTSGRSGPPPIAVLPSHREGLPLSLLEAADLRTAAGCRPTCRDAVTCAARSMHFWCRSMMPGAGGRHRGLALDPELRRKFGKASRDWPSCSSRASVSGATWSGSIDVCSIARPETIRCEQRHARVKGLSQSKRAGRSCTVASSPSSVSDMSGCRLPSPSGGRARR
jgi:hypothetical protein